MALVLVLVDGMTLLHQTVYRIVDQTARRPTPSRSHACRMLRFLVVVRRVDGLQALAASTVEDESNDGQQHRGRCKR